MFNILTGLCVTLLLCLLGYIFTSKKQKEKKRLPGPSGIPFFGCSFQIDKQKIHVTLDEWGYKYGEMFGFQLFGTDFLVLNSSNIARELLNQEPTATLTAGRPDIFSVNYIMKNSDIIMSQYSKEWSYRRKIAHQLLRAYGDGLRELEDILKVTLIKVNRQIQEAGSEIVDPTNIINDFLLENIEVMFTGNKGNADLKRCMVELNDAFNILMNPANDLFLSRFPFIRNLPIHLGRVFHQCLEARKRMMGILENTTANEAGVYKRLLKIVEEDETKQTTVKITMKHVDLILHDIVAAGYMTTSGSIMSIIKILMSKPDVQIKIQEELDRVVGRERQPRLNDRDKCPYIGATILESLRYISHTPLTVHSALEEFEFHGITVPKGCVIWANAWHIHHNEKEWKNPFQFNPERFLDEDGNLIVATHPTRKRLMTFGHGKRSCIGEVFAKSRIFLFMSTVLQQFKISPPTDEQVPLFHPNDMEPGIVLFPTDYRCRFIPR